MSQKFHDLEITRVIKETPSSVSISFAIPQNLQETFKYKNGQYITVKKDVQGQEVRRSYSLCSAPQMDQDFTIAVKEVRNGKLSPVLNNCKVGDKLAISAPEGNFVLNETVSNLYLSAGGSGVTPVISILKQALIANTKCTFVYANTEPDEIIFQEEINNLEAKYQEQLQLIHFIESNANKVAGAHEGRINAALFHQLKGDAAFASSKHFICGPSPMMKLIETSLQDQGIQKENIVLEYFEAPEENLADTSATGFSGDANVKVILDDEEINVSVNENETILSALLREGVDAPYSCQGGVCASCRALVSDGEVYLSQNLGITDGEVAEGFTLTCSSYPRSKEVVINFDEA